MSRPERFQLAFDFPLTSERQLHHPSVYTSTFAGIENRELSTNRFVRKLQEPVTVHTPADAAYHLMQHIFHPFETFDQEELWVLLFNTRHRITYEAMIYRGTINVVQIRLPEIFKEAVRVNSPALLLSHCHPSGDPTPSSEDVRMTELAVKAGEFLSIDVCDHIIVGDQRWISLKERGLGWDRQRI